MGYLDVVIPPDFIPEETSGDVMVPEGGTARVSCQARGTPRPRIMWRKEGGSDIVIRNASGIKNKGQLFKFFKLELKYFYYIKVLGTYLSCVST